VFERNIMEENKIAQAILNNLRDRLGEDEAVKRHDLLIMINRDLGWNPDTHAVPLVSDRTMRDVIFDLRCIPDGKYLCSTLKGGYFTARDVREVNESTETDHRRAMKLLHRISQQRKHAQLHELEPIQTKMIFG